MVDVATFLGAEKQFAKKEMLSVLEFEIQLAKYSLPREQRRNASRYVNRNVLHLQNSLCLHILASHYFFCRLYNPMRIKDLAALDPNTPWLEYINKILSPDIIQVCRNITAGSLTLCKVFIILLTFLSIYLLPKRYPILALATRCI